MISTGRVLCVAVAVALGVSAAGYIGYAALDQSPPNPPPRVVPFLPTPTRADLCGETVPLDRFDVFERYDREFTIVVFSSAQVYLWLKRTERWFPMIERELASRKLPLDLKFVAVAESDLLPNAASPAGAVGPWQFIASTGARYGLKQCPGIDERYDFERATDGAFKYLSELHDEFGSWPLALAAYNCGEKRVRDEIKRQRTSDYYSLKLPQETERYVFRILAIKEVLSRPERYGYSLPKGYGYPEMRNEKVRVRIPGATAVADLAEAAGVSYREFKTLNPCFVSDTAPEGEHDLRVPANTAKNFLTRVQSIKPKEKPVWVSHKVVKGESLSVIASRYDVSVKEICEWNKLKDDSARIGQVLRIQKQAR